MNPPPDFRDPFRGTYNPAFPVPDGGIAATFTGFGWIKDLFNTAIPQAVGDYQYVNTLNGGTFV